MERGGGKEFEFVFFGLGTLVLLGIDTTGVYQTLFGTSVSPTEVAIIRRSPVAPASAAMEASGKGHAPPPPAPGKGAPPFPEGGGGAPPFPAAGGGEAPAPEALFTIDDVPDREQKVPPTPTRTTATEQNEGRKPRWRRCESG